MTWWMEDEEKYEKSRSANTKPERSMTIPSETEVSSNRNWRDVANYVTRSAADIGNEATFGISGGLEQGFRTLGNLITGQTTDDYEGGGPISRLNDAFTLGREQMRGQREQLPAAQRIANTLVGGTIGGIATAGFGNTSKAATTVLDRALKSNWLNRNILTPTIAGSTTAVLPEMGAAEISGDTLQDRASDMAVTAALGGAGGLAFNALGMGISRLATLGRAKPGPYSPRNTDLEGRYVDPDTKATGIPGLRLPNPGDRTRPVREREAAAVVEEFLPAKRGIRELDLGLQQFFGHPAGPRNAQSRFEAALNVDPYTYPLDEVMETIRKTPDDRIPAEMFVDETGSNIRSVREFARQLANSPREASPYFRETARMMRDRLRDTPRRFRETIVKALPKSMRRMVLDANATRQSIYDKADEGMRQASQVIDREVAKLVDDPNQWIDVTDFLDEYSRIFGTPEAINREYEGIGEQILNRFENVVRRASRLDVEKRIAQGDTRFDVEDFKDGTLVNPAFFLNFRHSLRNLTERYFENDKVTYKLARAPIGELRSILESSFDGPIRDGLRRYGQAYNQKELFNNALVDIEQLDAGQLASKIKMLREKDPSNRQVAAYRQGFAYYLNRLMNDEFPSTGSGPMDAAGGMEVNEKMMKIFRTILGTDNARNRANVLFNPSQVGKLEKSLNDLYNDTGNAAMILGTYEGRDVESYIAELDFARVLDMVMSVGPEAVASQSNTTRLAAFRAETRRLEKAPAYTGMMLGRPETGQYSSQAALQRPQGMRNERGELIGPSQLDSANLSAQDILLDYNARPSLKPLLAGMMGGRIARPSRQADATEFLINYGLEKGKEAITDPTLGFPAATGYDMIRGEHPANRYLPNPDVWWIPDNDEEEGE